MRIIELTAENFKRLRAVTITPKDNVVEITGDNGEGKSSTLDAIWALLGGKDAAPDKPIRTGQESATIMATLGEGDEVKFKVTRRFRLKEGVPYTTDVIVESGEGARHSSPQGILDALVGSLCFDPLAFTRLPDKDQIAALRAFVPDVDFAEFEGLNRRDFDLRTEVGRRIRDLKGQLAAMPEVAGDVPEEVDVRALEAKLGEAATHNAEIARRKANREAVDTRLKDHGHRAAHLRRQAAELIEQAEVEEAHYATLNAQIASAEALPEPIDTDEVQRKLAEGRRDNEMIIHANRRRGVEANIESAELESTDLSAAIEKRKDAMAAAVAAAKMPIDGLGFATGDDPIVTLNGEPFAQASQAEKIRASVAIAAAMNPRLRVARIMDGSLLDKRSWAALEAYAKEHDLQVWIETVQQHGSAAVIIQDGSNEAVEPVGEVI